MSLGPAEILVILVIALLVFGPKRLPEVGRQVGSAMRELRRMQDNVRAELDTVLHPDITPADVTPPDATSSYPEFDSVAPALEEPDHTTLPAPTADDSFRGPPGSFT